MLVHQLRKRRVEVFRESKDTMCLLSCKRSNGRQQRRPTPLNASKLRCIAHGFVKGVMNSGMLRHIVLVKELFSTPHRLSHVDVMFLCGKPPSTSLQLKAWSFRFDHENLAFLLDSTLNGGVFKQHFDGTKTKLKQLIEIPIFDEW